MIYNKIITILRLAKYNKQLLEINNDLLKENNRLLNQIIDYIKYTESSYNKENEHDFIRNIIANLISNAAPFNRK